VISVKLELAMCVGSRKWRGSGPDDGRKEKARQRGRMTGSSREAGDGRGKSAAEQKGV
jgi:hypothetical protein